MGATLGDKGKLVQSQRDNTLVVVVFVTELDYDGQCDVYLVACKTQDFPMVWPISPILLRRQI